MDISVIKSSERIIEILHPASKEPLGIRVTLMSLDDERMKKIKRSILDRRLHLEARAKHFKAEEIEDNRNALIFSAMTGWEFYGEDATFKGEKPVFNRKNVYAVFDELEWFRDQLDEEIGDTKAFFDNSKAN